MKRYRQQLMRYIAQIKTLNQYEYNTKAKISVNPSYRDFSFRELNQNDLFDNDIFKEKDRVNRYLNHLKKGHQCYGFESASGDIAAYFWLTIGKPDNPIPNPAFKGFDWLISHNEAYIWDCRSVPAYQRQGLYREGLKRLIQLCQQQNIRKIMISSETDNIASDAGIKSVGFKFKGTTFTLKTKCFKLIRCASKKPKITLPSSPVTTSEVFPWA